MVRRVCAWIGVASFFIIGGSALAAEKQPAEKTPQAVAAPTPPFSWLIATSPIGLASNHYNLQFGHFLKPGMALSLKATRMSNAPQSLFGKDDGHEIGLRASWYQAETTVGITGQLGAYYINFRRGNYLEDALIDLFTLGTGSINRYEAKGPMIEGLTGIFLRSNSVLFELLGGLQFYSIAQYNYDTATGARTTLKSSSWDTYLVLEGNVGLVF